MRTGEYKCRSTYKYMLPLLRTNGSTIPEKTLNVEYQLNGLDPRKLQVGVFPVSKARNRSSRCFVFWNANQYLRLKVSLSLPLVIGTSSTRPYITK